MRRLFFFESVDALLAPQHLSYDLECPEETILMNLNNQQPKIELI